MADHDIIKEYLVALGFSVDQVSLRKFEDSLKRTGIAAEKFAKTMTVEFVAAGGAIVAALAAVGAGTIALASNVARQDLQFQIFARRMFIGTDAAMKMKIALDSLGYSMEEIIWGPPELAERYRQLIADQTNMIKVMGGDTGERAFRKLRDIQFEFTRMGPELIWFSRKLTEDLIVKMFGSLDNFENKLVSLNAWFQANIPAIADKISNVLVPAFEKVGSILGWVWDKTVAVGQFFQQWGNNIGGVGGPNDRSYFRGHGIIQHPDFYAPAGSSPAMSGMNDLISASPGASAFSRWLDNLIGRNPANTISEIAKKRGVDPKALMALALQESGMNPDAPIGKKGEIGMMQVLPRTGIAEGFSVDELLSLYYNVDAAAIRLKEGLALGGGYKRAFEYYNGSGPEARAYAEQVWKKYQEQQRAGATLQPQSFHNDMGGVTINITQPNATPEQIKRAVKEGIDAHVQTTSARNYAQRQGTYI